MKTIQRLELKVRRVPCCGEDPVPYGQGIRTPGDVVQAARGLLQDEAQEVFLAFPLDIKNKILGYCEVARGSVDACQVHAREVFRAAVLLGASSVILAHNHPSGDPAPSHEDDALTRRLVEAGKILGIQILDHVVVGDQFYSYQTEGKLLP